MVLMINILVSNHRRRQFKILGSLFFLIMKQLKSLSLKFQLLVKPPKPPQFVMNHFPLILRWMKKLGKLKGHQKPQNRREKEKKILKHQRHQSKKRKEPQIKFQDLKQYVEYFSLFLSY